MKPALRWYHSLAREMVCWTIGHKWKSSWRRRDDYEDRMKRSEDNKLTYREECEGNSYFWNSVSWSNKCKRCRITTRDESWQPFYVHLWWAVKSSLSDIKWDWHYYRYDSKKTRKDFVITICNNIWSFPKNIALYMLWDCKDFPSIVWEWILDIDTWFMMKLSYKEE